MAKKNEFEVRLALIQHFSKMMIEMSAVDFGKMTEQEKKEMSEDYEEVAEHLLDSVTFKPSASENGASFTAEFTITDPEEYIANFLKEIGDL